MSPPPPPPPATAPLPPPLVVRATPPPPPPATAPLPPPLVVRATPPPPPPAVFVPPAPAAHLTALALAPPAESAAPPPPSASPPPPPPPAAIGVQDSWGPPLGSTSVVSDRNIIGIVRFAIGLAAASVLVVAALLAVAATVAPRLAGWSAVSISSGSMEPAVSTGDVLLAESYDGQELRPGAILVFDDPVGTGFVSHRLVSVNDDGTLTTKGDANRTADSTPVELDAVVGVARGIVPAVGWLTLWLDSGDIGPLIVVLIAGALLLFAARWGISSRFDPWLPRTASMPVENGDRTDEDLIGAGSGA